MRPVGLSGVDNRSVAIIGSQSSGKSELPVVIPLAGFPDASIGTLLNNIFGTNFVVMDPHSRGRTTNGESNHIFLFLLVKASIGCPGLWLSCDATRSIIVMDVEGSDSGSRGDDRVGILCLCLR